MKFAIKSNGTIEGTSLVVDGVDVTKTQDIRRISFWAYNDGMISLSWSTIEKDDKDLVRTVEYNYDVGSKEVVRTVPGIGKESKDKIGSEAEIQFVSDADKAAFSITKELKILKNVKLVQLK